MIYKPKGSFSLERKKGRYEGFMCAAALCLLGLLVMDAAKPKELYRPPRATFEPAQGPAMHFDRVPLPPCTDMEAKDCVRTDDPKRLVVNTVPEPGTLALIPAALAAAHFTRRKS